MNATFTPSINQLWSQQVARFPMSQRESKARAFLKGKTPGELEALTVYGAQVYKARALMPGVDLRDWLTVQA